MKPSEIILSLIVVVLTAVIVLGLLELRKEDQLKQSVIDGLRRENKKEADSLTRNLKLTRDSLSIAFETIKQSRKESQEAHERTQRMIKNYEKIIFVRFTTDAQRDSVLTTLYPSFRPIR